MNRVTLVLALALAAGLSACGKVGALDRPGPLFGGAKPAADGSTVQDPTRPVTTVDPRDRNTDQPPAPEAPPAPR